MPFTRTGTPRRSVPVGEDYVGHASTEHGYLDMENGMNETTQLNAPDWRAFQEEVAALFTETHGRSARVNHPVRGSRIGVVHVDVLATYRPPREKGFLP